jgi:hypothetical protein
MKYFVESFYRRLFKRDIILPTNVRHDDVFIVEFPKSGITWFSTMLTNLLCLLNNRDIAITHYNIQQFIPAFDRRGCNIGPPLFEYPGYRFLKSHSRYSPKYRQVIYLLRNPYSVMQSYYRHEIRRWAFSGSLEHFIEDKQRGIESYKKHVESWLMSNVSPTRLHLIRYEDLRARPLTELLELSKNLGLDGVSQDIAEKAISRSEIEKMRESEALYTQRHPSYQSGFVRTGRMMPTSEEMPDHVRSRINQAAKPVLEKFYSDLKELS